MTQQLSKASCWILAKYINLEKELQKNLETYELAHSIDSLYTFLWDDFANWYVEYLKTDSTQLTFAKELFRQYVITLHPYSPFETEAIWKEFFGKNELLTLEIKDLNWSSNILKQAFPNQTNSENYLSQQALDFQNNIDFVSQIRSLKGLFAIDPALLITVYTSSELLLSHQEFIKIVAKAKLENEVVDGLYTVTKPQYTYQINILEYVQDKAKEISRTQKLILDLQKQIKALETQLNNPDFISKAEATIISDKKQNLIDRQLDIQLQNQKLDFLNSNS